MKEIEARLEETQNEVIKYQEKLKKIMEENFCYKKLIENSDEQKIISERENHELKEENFKLKLELKNYQLNLHHKFSQENMEKINLIPSILSDHLLNIEKTKLDFQELNNMQKMKYYESNKIEDKLLGTPILDNLSKGEEKVKPFISENEKMMDMDIKSTEIPPIVDFLSLEKGRNIPHSEELRKNDENRIQNKDRTFISVQKIHDSIKNDSPISKLNVSEYEIKSGTDDPSKSISKRKKLDYLKIKNQEDLINSKLPQRSINTSIYLLSSSSLKSPAKP